MNGMRAVNLKAAAALAIVTTLCGCVSSSPNPMAGMTAEQRAEAGRRVTVTPSPIATLEFKELGESKRFDVMKRLVSQTWGEACTPTDARVRSYSPKGASLWELRCSGSVLSYDYLVSLPERRPEGARVLKCARSGPRALLCATVLPS